MASKYDALLDSPPSKYDALLDAPSSSKYDALLAPDKSATFTPEDIAAGKAQEASRTAEASPFRGIASAWQNFAGSLAKGAATLMETNTMPVTGLGGTAVYSPELQAETQRRLGRNPSQVMSEIHANPLYEAGQAAQEAAPQLTPQEQASGWTKAGEYVGGALPMALGPLAVPAFALSAAGSEIDNGIARAKSENPNISDDEAAHKAITGAYESGAITGTFFAALPKALKGPLQKYVVDKIGAEGFSKWLGGRIASTTENALLMGSQRAAEQAIIEGKMPDKETLGAAGGGAIFGAVMPWAHQPGSQESAAALRETTNMTLPEGLAPAEGKPGPVIGGEMHPEIVTGTRRHAEAEARFPIKPDIQVDTEQGGHVQRVWDATVKMDKNPVYQYFDPENPERIATMTKTNPAEAVLAKELPVKVAFPGEDTAPGGHKPELNYKTGAQADADLQKRGFVLDTERTNKYVVGRGIPPIPETSAGGLGQGAGVASEGQATPRPVAGGGGETAPTTEPVPTPAEPAAGAEVAAPPVAPEAAQPKPERGVTGEPGAASAGEVGRFTETSTKNATRDTERELRGEDQIVKDAAVAQPDTVVEARKAMVDDPNKADSIVSRLNSGQVGVRDISVQDEAILLLHKVDLNKQIEVQKAILHDGSRTPEEHAAANEKWDSIEAKINEVDKATGASGGEWGRFGAFRQRTMKADYTFENLKRQARKSKGNRPLTKTESDRLEAQAAEIKKSDADVERARKNTEKSNRDKQSEATNADTKSRVEKSERQYKNTGKQVDVEKQRALIIDGMKRHVAEGRKISDLYDYVQKLSENFHREAIQKGEPITRDSITDKIHDVLTKDIGLDIPREFTGKEGEPNTQDLISGIGRKVELTTDPAKLAKMETRAQLNKVGKINRFLQKIAAPFTGTKRLPTTAEVRALEKEGRKLARDNGVVVTDPAKQLATSLEAKKTRLRNEIADLDRAISLKEPLVQKNGVISSDAETESLTAQRNAKSAEYKEMFGDPKMSDENRLKVAMAAAERADKSWQERLADAKKGIFDKAQPGRKVTSPELEAIKAHTDAAKAEVEHLKGLDVAVQESAKEASLQKSINELKRQISTGETEARTRQQTVDTQRTAELKSQRDELLRQKKEIQESKNPPRTESERKVAALEKRADEVRAKIDAGDISSKTGTPTADTQEVAAAKEEIAKLNKQLSDMRRAANPPKTPEEIRERVLDKQIADIEDRLAKNDLESKKGKPPVTSLEIEAKKAQLSNLNAEMAARRKAAIPVKSPEEIALQSAKTRIANENARMMDNIASNNFDRPIPKTKPVPDEELKYHQKINEQLKETIRQERLRDELAQRNWFQKSTSWWKGFVRANVLGHYSVLEHLGGAAIENIATRPVQSSAAQLFRFQKTLNDVRQKAVYHGGWGGEMANAKGILKSYKSVWEKFRTGKSDLDWLNPDGKTYSPAVAEWVGHIHAAIKEPVRQGIYARAMELGMKAAHEQGLEPQYDEALYKAISKDAFDIANSEIFLGDNFLTKALHSHVRSYLLGNKKDPGLAKFTADVLDMLFPIVNVPTNIAIRKFRLLPGAGFAESGIRLGIAAKRGELANGAETLSRRDAELITKTFSYGVVGSALSIYAWTNPQNFGGIVALGQQAPRDKDTGLKPGEIALPWGGHISHHITKGPWGADLNMIADARRLWDSKISKDPGNKYNAAGEVGFYMMFAAGKDLPMMSTVGRMTSPYQSGSQKAGELFKNMAIFGGIQDVAKATDTVERTPKNFAQEVESGIPGLRQTVPEKRGKTSSGGRVPGFL